MCLWDDLDQDQWSKISLQSVSLVVGPHTSPFPHSMLESTICLKSLRRCGRQWEGDSNKVFMCQQYGNDCGSWCIKETIKSMMRVDSSIPLMHQDPHRSWVTDPDPDHPNGMRPKCCRNTQVYNCIIDTFNMSGVSLFQDTIAKIPLVIYVSGFLSTFFSKPLNKYSGRKVCSTQHD